MIMSRIKNLAKDLYFRLPSSMILMFHHVGVNDDTIISSCVLSKEKFESICKSYYCITKEVDDCLKKNNIISFTFDDGFTDLYNIAYPIMMQYNIPFTVFVIEDFIGKPGYMNKEQIRELTLNPLVEIGSHGYSHKILTGMRKEEIGDEIQGTKKRLEDTFGVEIKKFAYSHGQYNDSCMEFVKSYETAYAADSKPINFITRKRHYAYPRINMTNDTFEGYIKHMNNFLRNY